MTYNVFGGTLNPTLFYYSFGEGLAVLCPSAGKGKGKRRFV